MYMHKIHNPFLRFSEEVYSVMRVVAGFLFAGEVVWVVPVGVAPADACATSLSPGHSRQARTVATRYKVLLSSIPSHSNYRPAQGKARPRSNRPKPTLQL